MPEAKTATKAKPRRPRVPKNEFALPERTPEALPVSDFTPVPRQYYRHDGWTPERQRAFIGALADTGCVQRAARMVNMAQTNCYTLRRAPGAEAFRRAWDAALDCGLKRLKDIAFERAIEGELIPVFAGGKLMGFRRKRNDALLMFVLRHYGQDREGKRNTINYFSSRASAGAGARDRPHPNPSPEGEGLAVAEASATTVRTVITGVGEAREDGAAVLERFEGVELDEEARAAIMAALEGAAARTREANAQIEFGGDHAADWLADDPDEAFVALPHNGSPYRGTLESGTGEEAEPLPEPLSTGESDWWLTGTEKPEWARTKTATESAWPPPKG